MQNHQEDGREQKGEDLEEVARISARLFESGYVCAESVLLAMVDEHGVESKVIPSIASGFCSGTDCPVRWTVRRRAPRRHGAKPPYWQETA